MSLFDRFKKNKEDLGKGSVAKQVKPVEKKEAKKAPAKAKAAKKEKKVASPISKMATRILIAPLASEKSARLSDRGVVVFKVARDANKNNVREAFREMYKVTPVRVNIIRMRGKAMRFGRTRGRTQDYKKALVTLPEGTRINIFEGV